MKTSYSALDTFEICPLKYKFQEIDRIPSPRRIEAVFGTAVHAALKFMFEAKPLFPTADEVINFFTSTWRAKQESIEWVDAERKDKEEKFYYEEGVKILRHFYKANQPWNFNPVALESRFSIEIVDDKTNETHTINGVIDRIDKNVADDSFEIIDYKTGKKMPSQDSVNANLQLGLYELALVDRWPEAEKKTIKTSLYFLKHGEKITSAEEADKVARRAKIKSVILEKIRDIETRKSENNFPPTPGPLCDYCGFRPICPMWSHEYKKKDAPTEAELKEALEILLEVKRAEKELGVKEKDAKAAVLSYMEKENVSRVFGAGGYVTKTTTERVSYDLEKAEEILKKAGVLEKILEPDEKKLAKLISSLPDSVQEKLKELETKKTSTMLKITKKAGEDDANE